MEALLVFAKVIRVAAVSLLLLAACSRRSLSASLTDAAPDTVEEPPAPLTLETGVDQAALAAAVRPQVVETLRAMYPNATFDNIKLGRPWAEFDLSKGPRLVFKGTWRMLLIRNVQNYGVVDATRDSEGYRMVGIGFLTEGVPTEREAIPAVNAALDRGRAALLRRVPEGDNRLLAYEDGVIADAGLATIRVQPLSLADRIFSGVDAGPGGVPEMTLEELDTRLPSD